ncbi:hypothetical protein LTR97_012155 [Elasticomyces elasticus]|uniref:Uncharacterized protein n=1 Tax=Elasticomyces elasticus TaxID=574655 RepID=A0AAN7VRC3_9PEZI|nr:hypothetical protein LTR97_012155 [Elasticomyces elasticus]
MLVAKTDTPTKAGEEFFPVTKEDIRVLVGFKLRTREPVLWSVSTTVILKTRQGPSYGLDMFMATTNTLTETEAGGEFFPITKEDIRVLTGFVSRSDHENSGRKSRNEGLSI